MIIFRTPGRPTPEQAVSGNYAKPTLDWHGLTIAIENPEGTVREGVDETGNPWRTVFRFAYGEFVGTCGVDGDPVDVYVGQYAEATEVYVVRQMKRKKWDQFDEDKCFVNFRSMDDARDAYLEHYDDPRFYGGVIALPVAEFITKVRATKTKPDMIKSISPRVLFIKSHIDTYTKKDGTVVQAHEDKRAVRTLYHGSSEHVTEIKDKGLFGGLFASGSHESASSHGDIVHKIDLPEDEIMTQSQLEDVSDDDLKAAAKWVDDEDIDRLRELVIDDEQADDDDARIMRTDDAGEASWEAQRIRGVLAKRAGFKAVEMNDEHGTSYLVLPGVPVAKHDGDMAKALPTILFFKAHVGAYLRGGKLVQGYQGRNARAVAGPPVQRSLVDADEHGEVPPARSAYREPQHTEPTKNLIAEHEHLVDVLRSPSHVDDKVEAAKQAGELKELKQGAGERPHVTETPEFKAWFGDSKVVDAEGMPLVVYHGSKTTLPSVLNAPYFYMTESNNEATAYSGEGVSPRTGERINPRTNPAGDVGAFYVSIKKPVILSSHDVYFSEKPNYNDAKIKQWIASGYDGVIMPWEGGNGSDNEVRNFIAFNPEQIKSAARNSGGFDARNPDITKSLPIIFLTCPR